MVLADRFLVFCGTLTTIWFLDPRIPASKALGGMPSALRSLVVAMFSKPTGRSGPIGLYRGLFRVAGQSTQTLRASFAGHPRRSHRFCRAPWQNSGRYCVAAGRQSRAQAWQGKSLLFFSVLQNGPPSHPLLGRREHVYVSSQHP